MMHRYVRDALRQMLLGSIATAALLGVGLAAPAQAAEQSRGIAAVFDQARGILVVTGDDTNNRIVVGRDAAGLVSVNNGAVPVGGGAPNVTNLKAIEIIGLGKNDHLALDEANGPLPGARLFGGDGNDKLSGGAGADTLLGEAGNDSLDGGPGNDSLDGGPGNDSLDGGPGDNQLLGGDGDDLFAWGDQAGNDTGDAGAGSDRIAASGSDAAEAFAAAGDGARLRFERRSPLGAVLDLAAVEQLQFSAGAGDDTLATGATLAPLVALTIEGADGADSLSAQGSEQSELYVLTADSGRVRVERSEPSILGMDLGGIERLDLNTGAGADIVAAGADVDRLITLSVDGAPLAAGEVSAESGAEQSIAATSDGVSASFLPSSGTLSVIGSSLDNAIEVSRNAAGGLLVNGGAVQITGGIPTVANTALIQIFGQGGNDTLQLNEANGALPRTYLFGGLGNDTLTGGSGGDQLFGQANDDTLNGNGGPDFLFGGTENDTLTGGDADDQVFGEGGDDRMIWNPGDDTDLNEGNDGSDTGEVNGGNGTEQFSATANGTRVRFDRINPAPFSIDIGTTEKLVLNAGGGDDSFSATGNLASLIQITIDGGAGADTLLGSNGVDTIKGGDGADLIDGQQGNDVALLGLGDDLFQWDPGDGSDTVEGQEGADRLVFNGSAGNELFTVAANGGRVRFTRNLATVLMDLNDIERLTVNALGGSDTLTVDDLSGTALVDISSNLAGAPGSTSGDAAVDSVVVNARPGNDSIDLVGAGTSASVVGLSASVNITSSEGALDTLTINALAGDDTVTATTLPAGVIQLSIDGGTQNDTLRGSQGADTFRGGDGNDAILGDNGNDLALLGAGDDSFEWQPGDGNDTVEGQANSDILRFFGSNVAENVSIVASGGRVLLSRNIANVAMNLDDVEQTDLRTLGGADSVIIGDLSGTDLTRNGIDLRGPNGGGDAAPDSLTINGSAGADTLSITGDTGGVLVLGLHAELRLFNQEPANDKLTINGQGESDTIDGSSLQANALKIAVNGGLGNDVLRGGPGAELFNGGDGSDTALMGQGDDTFVWNPGDDNDIVEGQGGFDALQFNGANVAESITIAPNGGRVRFSRDVASVLLDLDDVERADVAAQAGADRITIENLVGTDLTSINLALAVNGIGDAAVDTITLNGTNGDDTLLISGDSAGVLALGLKAKIAISGAETNSDTLTVSTLAGDDAVDASGLAASGIRLVVDGGADNDVLIGGAGNDVLTGGAGNDVLTGGPGADVLNGGPGSNVVIQ